MRLTLSASLTAAAILAACPASACGGGKVLFSDDFKQVDSSWGLDNPDVQVEDGKVKVKPQPDISNLLVYNGMLFGDGDLCITVRTPNKLDDNDNTMAGPIFWAKDYENYYMFMITPSGFAEVARKVEGKFITVVDWKQVADIKRPAGSNNLLEVKTLGPDITVSINDHPFATLKGQIPEGGGQIGMRAQSEKKQVDTWKFSQLAIYAVPGGDSVTPSSSPAPATVAPKAPDAAGQTSPQPAKP